MTRPESRQAHSRPHSRPTKIKAEQSAGHTGTPRGWLARNVRSARASTRRTRWSCRRSGTTVPSRSGKRNAEDQAECACRTHVDSAPDFSLLPEAQPDRPPRPETNNESANPVVDEQLVEASRGGPPPERTIPRGPRPNERTRERKSETTRTMKSPQDQVEKVRSLFKALRPRPLLRAWLPACGARLPGGMLRSYRDRRHGER